MQNQIESESKNDNRCPACGGYNIKNDDYGIHCERCGWFGTKNDLREAWYIIEKLSSEVT